MLWRLRALYMMTRRLPYRLSYQRRVYFVAVAALVLFLLMPEGLSAHTRTHTASARQHTAPQGRASGRHPQDRHPRHIAARAPMRARGRLAKASLNTHVRPSPRALSIPAPRPAAKSPRAALIVPPSTLVRNNFEATRIGSSLPSDVLEVDMPPPSLQVPVVSVIRPTADRPQLPSVEDAAATPAILPALYSKSGRLIMPPAMKGSHEILIHQNEVADRDGLARVQDDSDLAWMRKRAMLVALPFSSALRVDDRLPANRRYCRPWTAQFLTALSRDYYARFHTPLQVNSAVRTVEFQHRLLRTNGNAAPAGGETASPHLTGQAIDLAKRGLSLSEIAWLRGYLLPLVQQGKIDVEEEFQQSCFHISVYKSYMPPDLLRHEIAVTHRDRPAALAIALQ